MNLIINTLLFILLPLAAFPHAGPHTIPSINQADVVTDQSKYYDSNKYTLESEHFKVIFTQNQSEIATSVLQNAELAHKNLSQYFTEMPNKVPIVLFTHHEVSNGTAAHFPYKVIQLMPHPPKANTSLGYYDNWIYELILHELLHMVNYEPVNGLYTPFRAMLGSVVNPAFFYPNWFHEGGAVLIESSLSNGGRMQSPHYANKAFHLIKKENQKKLNFNSLFDPSAPRPPFDRSYFLGSYLLNKTLDSPEKLNDLYQKHSRSLPYFLNAGLKQLNAESYKKNYSKLFSAPPYQKGDYQFLSKHQGIAPQITNNYAYWVEKDNHGNSFLYSSLISDYVQNSNSPKINPVKNKKLLLKIFSMHSYKVDPADRWISYTASREYKKNIQKFSRVISLDTLKQLTSELQYIYSTDYNGRDIIGLKKSDLKTHLIYFSKENLIKKAPTSLTKNRTIYSAEFETRLTSPLWIKQSVVAFLEKQPNKKQQLVFMNIINGKIKKHSLNDSLEVVKLLKLSAKDTILALARNQGNQQVVEITIEAKPQVIELNQVPGGIINGDTNGRYTLSQVPTLNHPSIHLIKNSSLSSKSKWSAPKSTKLMNFTTPSTEATLKKKYHENKYNLFNHSLLPKYIFPYISTGFGGFSEHSYATLSTGAKDFTSKLSTI